MSSIWNLTTMVGGGGELLFTGPKTSPAIMSAETSPIDVLLAALGHCLALSAKITLEARKLGIDLITVKLRAEKASAKPNRLEKIRAELIIETQNHLDPDRIEKDVKRLCTVSNSLSCEIALEVKIALTDAT